LSDPWDETRAFLGTDRFVVERRIGEGSMGAVYLAQDRDLRARVALKTLRRVDPVGIYRFKREFRALADLHHPNLVRLHELFCERDQWFFTMEYVEGRAFLDYVLARSARRSPAAQRAAESWPQWQSGVAVDGVPEYESGEMRLDGLEMLFPTPLRDAERLRHVLVQITEGLGAVHAVGKLHRDLKPDNVLVTAQGRAVLLDFGIVLESEHESQTTLESAVLGTPAYMSPEQAANHPIDESSDFYALGAMLYEALTGTIPFDGPYMEVLKLKQQRDPLEPSRLVSGVPPDLEALCMGLLSRDAKARPRGEAILRALKSRKVVSMPPAPEVEVQSVGNAPFVGRAAELVQLTQALGASDGGKAVVALLSGPSGIGKTTLVERFIDEVVERGQAVVLQGRCYERESLPFKGIDSLVDALARHLRRLPPVQVAEVMPRDVLALAQLFPVLHRVEDVSQTKRRGQLPSDPHELRKRAFAALRELCSRVADRHPLVLFIDDLQWGDVDSARLLVELVTGHDAPAVLLLCAYRDVDQEDNACLRTLVHQLKDSHADVRRIQLGALSQEESVTLARTLLGDGGREGASVVGKEAAGSPYLLTELVRFVHGRDAQDADGISFEQALEHRLSTLSKDSRMLLQLLSVAARPVPEDMLALASAFNIDLQAGLSELRGEKLVRGVATRDGRAVECYHDRVREAVTSQLPPELLALWHRRLASTLEASGSQDLEALAVHLLGAGEHARAGLYALRAAAQAERALAFDKAARLYSIAVAHHAQGDTDKRELLARWGDALVAAGRGGEAASVYLEISELAQGADALDLRRKAGVQLVLGGYVEEGLSVLHDLLARLQAPFPDTAEAALQRCAQLHAELHTRGLDTLLRNESQVPTSTLAELDTLWAVALGVLVREPHRPLPWIARYLQLALEAGERERVYQGLCLYHALIDAPLGWSPLGALSHAEKLVAGHDAQRSNAMWSLAHGLAASQAGDAAKAASALQAAEELLHAQGPSGVVELRVCRVAYAQLVSMFGLVDALDAVSGWAREAEERNDQLLAVSLGLLSGLACLVRDEVDAARQRIAAADLVLHDPDLELQRRCLHVLSVQAALYEQDPSMLAAAIEAIDRLLAESRFWSTSWQVFLRLSRARVHLALAELSASTPSLQWLTEADNDVAEALASPAVSFVDALRVVSAGIALARGDTAAAIAGLDAVLSSGEAQQQPLLLASALRRRAELGQARVAGLVQHADGMMRERGVVDPERMAQLFAPGAARASTE
jgi:eukaryotic-like serine/threonine-protein kinase